MALVWRKMAGGGARMPLLCRALSQAPACTRAEFCHMSQSLYKVRSKSSVVDPDSVNPDPDTAPGFWWPKIEEEKIQLKFFSLFFFNQKLQFVYPRPPYRTSKLQEKTSAPIWEHPALQKRNFLTVFYFSRSFLPSWIRRIRIRIRIQGPRWIRIQSGSGSKHSRHVINRVPGT